MARPTSIVRAAGVCALTLAGLGGLGELTAGALLYPCSARAGVSSCEGMPDGTACDDANFCTSNDKCSDGSCRGGRTCDDKNVCTTDTCDAVGQTCTNVNNTSACSDKDRCTEDDTCSDGICMGVEIPGCGVTTTTTSDCLVCGNVLDDDCELTAGDALVILRTAVGLRTCAPFICDFNGSGGVTAADALAVLRTAVGQEVSPACPPGGTSTTMTTMF